MHYTDHQPVASHYACSNDATIQVTSLVLIISYMCLGELTANLHTKTQ